MNKTVQEIEKDILNTLELKRLNEELESLKKEYEAMRDRAWKAESDSHRYKVSFEMVMKEVIQWQK